MKTLAHMLDNYCLGMSYLMWIRENINKHDEQERKLKNFKVGFMNFELVSYKEYPMDKYTKALCSILLDGKYLLTYGQKMTKDGRVFWSMPTHSVQETETEKEFVDGFSIDSKSLNTQIIEFVRQQAKQEQYKQLNASAPISNVSGPDDNLPF